MIPITSGLLGSQKHIAQNSADAPTNGASLAVDGEQEPLLFMSCLVCGRRPISLNGLQLIMRIDIHTDDLIHSLLPLYWSIAHIIKASCALEAFVEGTCGQLSD